MSTARDGHVLRGRWRRVVRARGRHSDRPPGVSPVFRILCAVMSLFAVMAAAIMAAFVRKCRAGERQGCQGVHDELLQYGVSCLMVALSFHGSGATP